MQNGNQQASANADVQRQLQQVERLRNQLQSLAQQGQQNGQGNQNAQGNQGGGPGGNFGARLGGAYNGNYGRFGRRQGYDPRLGYGRFNPQGVYDVPDENNVPPGQVGREVERQLEELRQMYKDDKDVSRQIQDLQSEVQRMQFGATASPELAARINREVLPQLETLEVALRRNLEEKGEGQARSGASDKVPAGYVEAVADYFRKLSGGK
jgi:hypothetical protein